MVDFLVQTRKHQQGSARTFVTLKPIDSSSRFVSNDEVSIEKFDNGYLVFNAKTLKIIALDEVGYLFLDHMVKSKSLGHAEEKLSDLFESTSIELLTDLVEYATEWEKAGIIKRVITLDAVEDKVMSNTKFMGNPQVSCREELPEGAILYHPGKNIFHVLNDTGLIIWESISEPLTVKEMVYEITRQFEDVPVESVVEDVEEFLNTLTQSGFVLEIDS